MLSGFSFFEALDWNNLYLSDSKFVEFIFVASKLKEPPIKNTDWSHSEDFTLKASTINPSNRPTALYNSWNKLTLNALASPLNQHEDSTLKTGTPNSLPTEPISFPELRSPWPAVGKRELWEQPFQACAIDADAQWAG